MSSSRIVIMKWILGVQILKSMQILIVCPPAGMEPEEGGAFSVGSKTSDVDADGPLFANPDKGPAIVVTTEDAVMAPTIGVEEATQTVGIVRTEVTDTL